jgi:peroxiredoxin
MMSKKNSEDNEKGLPKAALVIIILVVVAAVVFIVLGQKEKFEPVVAGTVAPEFELPGLDGKQHKLSEYKGKVVFLNFWATWCKPCAEEIPSMQMLHENLKSFPFEIVAVSVDKDGPEVIEPFLKKYGVTFPVLHDRKGRVKELYKTTGVPETFILDQNGVIAEKVWGPRDWADPASTKLIMELIQYGPKDMNSYKSAR